MPGVTPSLTGHNARNAPGIMGVYAINPGIHCCTTLDQERWKTGISPARTGREDDTQSLETNGWSQWTAAYLESLLRLVFHDRVHDVVFLRDGVVEARAATPALLQLARKRIPQGRMGFKLDCTFELIARSAPRTRS